MKAAIDHFLGRQIEHRRKWRVTELSLWTDQTWTFPHPTSGYTSINWSVLLEDGSQLSDEQHADLLEELKVLVWSLFYDRRGFFKKRGGSKPLTAGSADKISVGVGCLARWMVGSLIGSLAEITNEASKDFLDFAIEQAALVPDDSTNLKTFCSGAVLDRIRLVGAAWHQRNVLIENGVRAPSEAPFDGLPVMRVSEAAATKVVARIPPLPDEVSLPIMAAAHRLIGEPANNVIDLVETYFRHYIAGPDRLNKYGHATFSPLTRHREALKILEKATFSVLSGECDAWHPPLSNSAIDNNGRVTSPTHELGNLIRDIATACMLVLQSEAGVRIGEMVMTQAGLNHETGLPSCIERRYSKSGLLELFYFKSNIVKTTETPEEMEWLLASRPVGATYVPPPVRAVEVLQKLFERYREHGDESVRGRLLLVNRRSLAKSVTGVSRATPVVLNLMQMRFIDKYVDFSKLPNTSSRGEDLSRYCAMGGAAVRSHQWRKSFALYVFRVDSRMLPAIALQFKHLSLAMTEQSYIGNDPTMLEDMDSVRRQETTRFFLEYARGRRSIAGPIAQMLHKHVDELESLIADLRDNEARAAIDEWATINEIRIWFSNDGKCFGSLKPDKMRCHEIAGTGSWQNNMPNLSVREPSVCFGCSLYGIDREHLDYHRDRYISNFSAWKTVEGTPLEREYRVSLERAQQAKKVLRALKSPIPEIENA